MTYGSGISPDAPDEDKSRTKRARSAIAIPTRPRRATTGRACGSSSSSPAACCAATYCHNPDTWHLKDGTYVSVDHVLRRLGDFAPTLRQPGRRPDDIGRRAHGAACLHPARYSPAQRKWGCIRRSRPRDFWAIARTIRTCRAIDLVLLDIKSSDPGTYRRVTGRDLAPTLRFAERLASISKPVWVRFTLVPGATDDPANVDGIARFVAPMKNVEWVEVQPFHQMGAFKWTAMGLDYKHIDTQPPSRELVNRVIGQFRAAGCTHAS